MTPEEQLNVIKTWKNAQDEIKTVTQQIEPYQQRLDFLNSQISPLKQEVINLVTPEEKIKLFTVNGCAIILEFGKEIQEIPVTGSTAPRTEIPLVPVRTVKTRKRTPRIEGPMNPIVVENWSCLDPYFYWINERQRILLKKQAGEPWPWTEDPILREFSFCNVFREDDRVTRWISSRWRSPYANHPNLWFAMVIARHFNWPNTLEVVGFPDFKTDEQFEDWKETAVLALEKRQQEGHKIYTGAYMIRADASLPDQSKIRYSFAQVLSPVWKSGNHIANDPKKTPFTSIEKTTDWLAMHYGFGPFMGYESATDLRHTRYLNAAPDIMTFANPGPGAVRGLNRIFGRPYKDMLNRKQAIAEMQFLLAQCPKYLGKHITQQFEMRDVEGALCETDKFLRVKNGEGRPRAKFSVHGDRGYQI